MTAQQNTPSHDPGGFLARVATITDSSVLAAMNWRLIRDEGHRNSMSESELEVRMRGWLTTDYEATLFQINDLPVGYALYRHETEWTYLRQFFVIEEWRRRGIGRSAMIWLRCNPWQAAPRIRLDVLVHNTIGIQFWRAVGFQDYCVTMELDNCVERKETLHK